MNWRNKRHSSRVAAVPVVYTLNTIQQLEGQSQAGFIFLMKR